MTFSDDFPSLKGKIEIKSHKGLKGITGFFVHISDIKDNCLDKQRVKEEIDKLLETDFKRREERDSRTEMFVQALKKEWGLE